MEDYQRTESDKRKLTDSEDDRQHQLDKFRRTEEGTIASNSLDSALISSDDSSSEDSDSPDVEFNDNLVSCDFEEVSPETDVSKRNHHNKLERKRRDELRGEFETTAKRLSTTRKMKVSREQVLTESEKYIYYMKLHEQELSDFEEADNKLTEKLRAYGQRFNAIMEMNLPPDMKKSSVAGLNAEFGLGPNGIEELLEENDRLNAWHDQLPPEYDEKISKTIQMSPIKKNDDDDDCEDEEDDDDDDDNWEDVGEVQVD